jgi:hypothetical protein
MALDDFRHIAYRRFKTGEIVGSVVRERDFREYQKHVAKLAQMQLGSIAGDVAGAFQTLDPGQARAWRKPDRIGEIDIGDASVLLQFGEDLKVYSVQLRQSGHNRYPTDAGEQTVVTA